MLMTINEVLAAFTALKKKHGGDTCVAIIDRVLTTEQADRLADCSFDAAHTAIEEDIHSFNA